MRSNEGRSKQNVAARGRIHEHMTVPPAILSAVSDEAGGCVVLVVGAGASFEAPTNLPLSRACAAEAFRQLVANGVLSDESCTNPDDLTCVADAVVQATGNQRALVECLPLASFRSAEPNEGYLMAACLLRERAIGSVMTLNFDLGMSAALVQLGARDDVGVVSGPDEHHRLGLVNLIYLHRNVNAPPDAWILRSTALDDEWRDRWEEVIATRVMAAPVTVFAGLGSAAAVLSETISRIRKAIPDGTQVFQVDPGRREDSEFFADLELPDEAYLEMGWCSFARQLGARLLEEHRHELGVACRRLISESGWQDADPSGLCQRLSNLGLIGLGELRARWMLDPSPYAPRHIVDAALVADLLLAVGLVENAAGVQAIFDTDGIVELRRGNEIIAFIAVASGRGTKRWAAMEAEFGRHVHRRRRRIESVRVGLVSGVEGPKPVSVAPPTSIVLDKQATNMALAKEPANVAPPTSIVDGDTPLRLVSVEELRAAPSVAKEMAA
jgi:hypothetical protein